MENDIKDLHNRLSAILKNRSFLMPLSKYFHDIVDDMWEQNSDFISTDSQTQIGKTEYIYRFIKNILLIDELKYMDKGNGNEEIVGLGAILFENGKITLLVDQKILQRDFMNIGLKIVLSHEIGHLRNKYLENYNLISGFKGEDALKSIVNEGLTEETAKNNLKSKQTETIPQMFKYLSEDGEKTYYFIIPQTGYSNGYQVITNIYMQLKTIMPDLNFNRIFGFNEKDGSLVEIFTRKMETKIGNRNFVEQYLLQCICTYESFPAYDMEKSKNLKREEYFEKHKKDIFKITTECEENISKWNKKVDKYRLKTNFEENFIKLQRDFFVIMSKVVERADTIEDVYKILKDVEFFLPNLPIIKNIKRTDFTKEETGMLKFQQACRNKINELQKKGNCSKIPVNKSQNEEGQEH